MSKLNPKAVTSIPQTFSANGNLQDTKDSEQQAIELLFNTLYGRDSFYESTDEKATRLNQVIADLVRKGKVDFVANLLLFARSEMHIRNMPIMGLKAFSDVLRLQNRPFAGMRSLTAGIIQRADQITDTLALFVKGQGKSKMPMAVKRGLSDAFNKFDEYQFAKYNRGTVVSLKDALRIVHPTPTADKNSALFQKIMTDSLTTADTWEVAMSTNGQKDVESRKDKKEVWEDLIVRNKLGYQALLKNLRNILQAGVSEDHLRLVATSLIRGVANSKSLPFEFWTAYNIIEQETSFRPLLNALENCMDISAANIPTLGRKVWVVMDVSGSMRGRALETAAFFTAAIAKAHKDADYLAVTQFADRAGQVTINPNNSILTNYKLLMQNDRSLGGSTNFKSALEAESTLGFKPDAVFVLTDGEINDFGNDSGYYGSSRSSNAAVQACAPGANKYVINMESAESTPLPSRFGWVALAGWSTKLFDLIELGKSKASVINKLNRPYPYTSV